MDTSEPVHGTYQDGTVELDVPVTWPNGSRVTVIAEPNPCGMTEADWPTTPEGIAAHIARMEAQEVPEMSEEEWAEWQAAREANKQYTIANMEKHIPKFDP